MGFSFTDRENLWTNNGGDPIMAPFMAAVSSAENPAGDPAVISQWGDVGMWQVNPASHPQYSVGFLQDPNNNAKAAIAISGNGQDVTAWCTAYSNPNADCGHGGPSYLSAGSPIWAHMPAGATLPRNAPAGAGAGGKAATATSATGAQVTTGPTAPRPCQIKTPKLKMPGPLPDLGPWCIDGPAGVVLVGAGLAVMLTGTVVVLFRFQATRDTAKKLASGAATLIPGGGAVGAGARAAGASGVTGNLNRRERRTQTVLNASEADRKLGEARRGQAQQGEERARAARQRQAREERSERSLRLRESREQRLGRAQERRTFERQLPLERKENPPAYPWEGS